MTEAKESSLGKSVKHKAYRSARTIASESAKCVDGSANGSARGFAYDSLRVPMYSAVVDSVYKRIT